MNLLKGQTRDLVKNYPMAERGGRGRIWELDFLRGFTIILMCIDHLMFDLSSRGMGFATVWKAQGGAASAIITFAQMWWGHTHWIGKTRDVIQVIAWCIFFGLCGGSTIFSRDNWTRTMKTMLAAAVITTGTFFASYIGIIEEEDVIVFGVLHMLSFATLIVSIVYALTRLAKEKGDLVFFVVCLLLANAVFLLDAYFDGATLQPDHWLFFLHEKFAIVDWVGGDYFPMIPFLGYVFAGAAVITLIYGSGESLLPQLDGKWNRPFRFVGRHTLLVVIAHQIVIMLLLALITGLFVDFGNFVIF